MRAREQRDREICHWNKKHPMDKRIFPGFWFLSGQIFNCAPLLDLTMSLCYRLSDKLHVMKGPAKTSLDNSPG